jgi:putative transposase
MNYPIERMCKALKVNRSSYYRWLNGGTNRRKAENVQLLYQIKEIFESSNQTNGSPRIRAALIKKGYRVSKPRVARIMRANGIRSKVKRKFKITTDSNHSYPISPNILNRAFTPKSLNEAWVSDITYIRTKEGWLYLTTIIDLFNRQIIGWALSNTMYAKDTVIAAMRMALSRRKISSKLIFHSDRGVQYACKEFRKLLKKNKFITQSMSRKANCWDNAVAESFFKTLKSELIYHQRFETRKQAELAVFEYIEIWYNRKRLHSTLGYKTPAQIEAEFNTLNYVA